MPTASPPAFPYRNPVLETTTEEERQEAPPYLHTNLHPALFTNTLTHTHPCPRAHEGEKEGEEEEDEAKGNVSFPLSWKKALLMMIVLVCCNCLSADT